MLRFMRKNAQSMMIRVMFGAIVVVFIFWGIGVVGFNRAEVVARIDDEIVDPEQFSRAYTNLLESYRRAYKGQIPPQLLSSLNLKGRAIDQLVRIALLRREAERLGLQVSDQEVTASISSLPAFQSNGVFVRQIYLATLRNNNISPGEFEEAQRDALLVRKVEDIIGAGVQVSEQEIRDQYHYDNDKVNLTFARIGASNFVAQVEVADDSLQVYFDANKESFRTPERVRIEYLLYKPEAFKDQVTVSDEDVQLYYDIRRSQYDKPEEVQARHILFRLPPNVSEKQKAEIRGKAEEVLAKARAGEDFAGLARQYSEDSSAPQGGDLGFFRRGQMVAPFEAAAFALETGAISDIVESTFGFHIIKVEAKHAAHTQTVDEARGEIVETLRKDRASEAAGERARTDQEKVIDGDSLAAVGAAAGIAVTNPPPFAQSEAIIGIGRQQQIIDAAFAIPAGEVGDVVGTDDGVYLFRTVEKIPSRIPELQEAHEEASKAFRQHKAEELAQKRAGELLEQIKSTPLRSALASAAEANGFAVNETGPFARSGGYVPKLDDLPELKKDAFELSSDRELSDKVYQASGDAILVALKERLPADDAKFEDQRETLREQLLQRRQVSVQEKFLDYLKSRAEIDINRDFLAKVPDTGYLPR